MRMTIRGSAAAAVLVLPGLLLAGCGSTQPTAAIASASVSTYGDLSNDQYDAAVALARQEVARDGATITSATATLTSGTVEDTNLPGTCTSGKLLNIKLIGTDFAISVGGTPGGDTTVSGVLLTADADSGEACMLAVKTGAVSPDPGAVTLSLG